MSAIQIPTTTPTGGGLFDAYALLRDEKAANTDGGTFTSGAWQTRTLNTEAFDPDGIVSLASNQFTLQAGSYWLLARAPANLVNSHTAKIANITDTVDAIIGAAADCRAGGVQTDSIVTGRVTIDAAKVFELRHRCATTRATDGFGASNNFAVVEVYAEVQIWREVA